MSLNSENFKEERNKEWRSELRSKIKGKDRTNIERVKMPELEPEIRVKSHARCLFPCYGDLERHLDPPERAISIFKVSHYSNLLRPCSNSSGGACYLVHKKKNPRFRRGFVVIGRL